MPLPGFLYLRAAALKLFKTFSSLREVLGCPLSVKRNVISICNHKTLTSSPPIPSFGVLQVCGRSNAHRRKITQSVLCLCQARLGGLPSPEVGFCITLLQDSLRACQVPATQGQFALMLSLHGGTTIPYYTLPMVNRISQASVFKRTPNAEL